MRGPAAPGLSTSTTQPSITVGASSAGAMGAVTASVLSFAAASPSAKQATISNIRLHTRARCSRRPISHPPEATTAKTSSGQTGGSAFRVK